MSWFTCPATVRNPPSVVIFRAVRSFIPAVCLLLFLESRVSADDTSVAPIRYHSADCHLHYVDFLQHTDGMKALLGAMDKSGVDEAMISGMPLMKEWDPQEHRQPLYYLDDDARCYWYSATDVLVARELEALPVETRKRFHPFICGFNAEDRNAVEHIRRMMEWYPKLWEGIGEVMTRHDDLTALTYGEVPHADSPGLDPIYNLAAENDLPVSVHSDMSSVWKREPIYLVEMENAVRSHPKTRIIWCHAGISRRIDIPDITNDLGRLLKTYPNLWIDLAWVVFEEYLGKGGVANPKWVDLVEQFPDRFMIGSDKVGHFASYPHEMQKYYLFLDALKPTTARKVARDNFLSILPGRAGATAVH